MAKTQSRFILQTLDEYPVCSIKEKYTNRLEEISTPAVQNILRQKFINGPDMKAVLCLFDTLFLGSNPEPRQRGLVPLSRTVQRWITKMKKLDISSVQGFVYMTDILSEDIQVIIKVPQRVDGFNGLVREYFLGIMAFNKLRYHIPTVVYTLGAFICPQPKKGANPEKTLCSDRTGKTAFVIYEKVPGFGVENMLKDHSMTFNQFLGVYIQLLLTLEVAQRECRFTHFDLHAGNVMVRRAPGLSYDVPLGTSLYKVSTPDFIPMIIDFGFSTAFIDGRSIGEYEFTEHGMMPFMVQGYDMYKFLVFSTSNATDKRTKALMIKLFEFYGDDDYYKIVTKGAVAISASTNEYTKQATFSKMSTYTPQMFINWILKHNEFGPIANQYITVVERYIYFPIRYSNAIQEYDHIFNRNEEGRDKAIQLTENCLTSKPSYMLSQYNIKVLSKYNETLQDLDLTSRIRGLSQTIITLKDNMIRFDMALLNKYIDIQYPSQDIIDTTIKETLDIPILETSRGQRGPPPNVSILREFFDSLQPYLQFLYTIREINLQDQEYIDWESRFILSFQYEIYYRNCIQFDRVLKWEKTLDQASKMTY